MRVDIDNFLNNEVKKLENEFECKILHYSALGVQK